MLSVKKLYEAPVVVSEGVFETLATGCTLQFVADPACDPHKNEDGVLNASL